MRSSVNWLTRFPLEETFKDSSRTTHPTPHGNASRVFHHHSTPVPAFPTTQHNSLRAHHQGKGARANKHLRRDTDIQNASNSMIHSTRRRTTDTSEATKATGASNVEEAGRAQLGYCPRAVQRVDSRAARHGHDGSPVTPPAEVPASALTTTNGTVRPGTRVHAPQNGTARRRPVGK